MELAFLIAQYLADEREEELSRETGLPVAYFAAGEATEAFSAMLGRDTTKDTPRLAPGRGFSPGLTSPGAERKL